jgi:phosphoglycerol transferase MdoB-like AlkP superfamily enzyme
MQIMFLTVSVALTYTLQRAFFCFWNWDYYKDQTSSDLVFSFIKGFQYDLSASASLFAMIFPILILGQWMKLKKQGPQIRFGINATIGALIFALHFPLLILACIDSELVFITGQRFTWGALYNFKEVPGKASSFTSYYFPLMVAYLLLASLMILIIWQSFHQKWAGFGKTKASLIKEHLIVFTILIMFIFCGLQFHPLNFAQANSTQKPILYNLTLNSTYNFIHSLNETEKELERLNSGVAVPQQSLPGFVSGPSFIEGLRPSKPQNVVLFILESFNKEYSDYTPFLNELGRKGISFQHNYASGRRSIEGVSSILAGIPSFLSTPFILTEDFKAPFQGLGSWLRTKGYDTSFFHGAHNSTMHFKELTEKIGIEHYYGLNEYPKPEDHDGAWGIPDHIYMQYMLEVLNKKNKPFFAALFTLSSHHPFKVPAQFKNRFKKSHLDIIESIQYTDESIRLFFDSAQNQPWFKNTLFVFVADHTYKPINPFHQNLISNFEIPLIFYHPTMNWPAHIDNKQVTSQLDIVPSLLDFLGIKSTSPRLCLGKSVFAAGPRSALNYLDRKDILITKDYLAVQFLFKELNVYSPEDQWLQTSLNDKSIQDSASKNLQIQRQHLNDFFKDVSRQPLCPEF